MRKIKDFKLKSCCAHRGWILFFAEDKIGVDYKRIGIWGCPYVDWLNLGSDGASSGMLIMWDRRW